MFVGYLCQRMKSAPCSACKYNTLHLNLLSSFLHATIKRKLLRVASTGFPSCDGLRGPQALTPRFSQSRLGGNLTRGYDKNEGRAIRDHLLLETDDQQGAYYYFSEDHFLEKHTQEQFP